MLQTVLNNLVRGGGSPSLACTIRRSDADPITFHAPRQEAEPLYDLASLTKPLLTFPLVHQVLGNRQRPVSTIIPELLPGTTVEHLAGHNGGLIPWLPCYLFDAPYVDTIVRHGRGTAGHTYTCLGYILLARLLEKAASTTFQQLANTYLNDFPGCEVNPGVRPEIMPTEWGNHYELELARTFVANPDPGKFRLDQLIHGSVHDLNAFYDGGVSGNAGLFATSVGCAELARALVSTPGWQISMMKTDAYYYHLGFTGTGIAISPDGKMIVTFLSNRIHPEVRPMDFTTVRHQIFETAFAEYA